MLIIDVLCGDQLGFLVLFSAFVWLEFYDEIVKKKLVSHS